MAAPLSNPGRTWIFYAAPGQRGAKWLEEVSAGGYVFWRHGSNAYTREMMPGDTALIYLAGEGDAPPGIVAVAAIAAVRKPFILDATYQVQRIPALLVEDLRERPVTPDHLASLLDRKDLKLITNRGAIHPVDDDVVAAFNEYTGLSLPLPAPQVREMVFGSDLWGDRLRYGASFIIFEDFLSQQDRKTFRDADIATIEDPETFRWCLEEGWREDDETKTSKTKTSKKKAARKKKSAAAGSFQESAFASEEQKADTPREAGLDSLIDDLELDSSFGESAAFESVAEAGAEKADFSNFDFEEAETDLPEPASPSDRELKSWQTPGYSGTGTYTAAGMPDRVTADSEDHLQVGKEARAFARLLASTSSKPPLSVGIFGRWGSGKTFFMTQISKELDKIADTATEGFHKGIVQVDFNAWHYMETNVWASLVDVIFTRLDEERLKKDDSAASKSLFDELSTAQNLRFDAIESLAQKIQQANEARDEVARARNEFRKNGPDGAAIWEAIRTELADSELDHAEMEKAAANLGFDKFSMAEAQSLQSLTERIHKTQNDGHLAIQMLRRAAINPPVVIIFAIIMGLFALSQISTSILPEGAGTILPNLNLQQTLSGIVATFSAFGALVATQASKAINLVQRVGSGLASAEKNALSKQREALDKAELALQEAHRNLELAEQSADEAYQSLASESPGARLAEFIQRRAESDDYSKHLGIIATIRKDFEQLSALMGGDSEEEKDSMLELEKFREGLEKRIEHLKSEYEGVFTEKSGELDRQRIVSAVEELQNSLHQKPDEYESPFTRIVLKIDDLDRCPAEKVADVLQAIHLFLNFPLFVILVCVDERWMSTSLIEKYKKLVNGSSGATTGDYLEKIFQIPYWTRPMHREASADFATALISGIPDGSDFEDSQANDLSEIETDTVELERVSGPEETIAANPEVPESSPDQELTGQAAEVFPQEMPIAETEDELENRVTERLSEEEETEQEAAVFAPLTLSEAERGFIRDIAGFAGNTPRRTLRFVNVYLLIKSSMEEQEDLKPFVDPSRDSFAYQALLIQLALATRADDITSHFFETLGPFRYEQKPKLDQFLKAFSDRIKSGSQPSTSLSPLCSADKQLAHSLIDVIQRIAGVDANSANSEKFDALGTLDSNTALMRDLLNTHMLARRYTFVPPEL